jgi:hypothetical protein
MRMPIDRPIAQRQAVRLTQPANSATNLEPFTSSREDDMSVDGTWNMTMSTPMGERKATLTVKSAGNALTGTQSGEQGSAEIADGKVDGNKLSWKVSIQNPMPLTLEFSGTVDGNAMKGEMGVGFMGSFPFTGTKA